MNKYDAMSQEDFDRILFSILEDVSILEVIRLSEDYNIRKWIAKKYINKVLDRWAEEQEMEL